VIYFCCDARRRDAVRAHPILNGIDFLEVLDSERPAGSPRQRTLLVHLLKPVPALTLDNLALAGGVRITPVRPQWIGPASAPPPQATAAEVAFLTALNDADHILVVRTDAAGDFSRYTLRLVRSATDSAPPGGFDPLLSQIDFSFRVECASDFDCAPVRICVEPAPDQPDIDYLAKDYASFRRLMLDRMSVLMPAWRERSAADLGVTLVELLAYVGDHLSYRQDAIATEAYLGTARRRASVRRHARLVDYRMHDGCNARAWVQVAVSGDLALAQGTQIMSRTPGFPSRIPASSALYDDIMRRQPLVFETMHGKNLFAGYDTLAFYTWGDQECCLPQGATRATLRGSYDKLAVGDVLVFEEVMSPRTGRAEDADVGHRHAVRLTDVVTAVKGQPLVDPLNGRPITEIAWSGEDAVPFCLCVSARTDPEHGAVFNDTVSVARGNIVLADHGRRIVDEALGTVPQPRVFLDPPAGRDRCARTDRVPVPPRFHPVLANRPLTQAAPYDVAAAPPTSARAATHWLFDAVVPFATLTGNPGPQQRPWEARRDLLGSEADDTHVVIEVEGDGSAQLRFGDDRHGLRPDPGDVFLATYRVGNGAAGNVGAEALAHVVCNVDAIEGVRNPMPAAGGIEPETIEEVRTRAPYAFRRQERAVTPDDYADVTERAPQIQQAAATFRWTGSWHTVFVTADRAGGLDVDAPFESELRAFIEPYRMAGYDLEVDGPRYVPLEIEMQVCVRPDYFRSDVKAALLDLFSARVLADGRRGLFHPDAFSFGQPVYLSRLYAAAQVVPGVESVTITKFGRQGETGAEALEDARLDLGRLEIARLDNDRNFPERGVFRLQTGGGK
jgi:Baseplate J-like protein